MAPNMGPGEDYGVFQSHPGLKLGTQSPWSLRKLEQIEPNTEDFPLLCKLTN